MGPLTVAWGGGWAATLAVSPHKGKGSLTFGGRLVTSTTLTFRLHLRPGLFQQQSQHPRSLSTRILGYVTNEPNQKREPSNSRSASVKFTDHNWNFTDQLKSRATVLLLENACQTLKL